MKIISQEDPKLWLYKFTCKTCKTVAEANCNDVEVGDINDTNEYFYIDCPVCNQNLVIKDLPEIIKIKSRSRYKYSIYDR